MCFQQLFHLLGFGADLQVGGCFGQRCCRRVGSVPSAPEMTNPDGVGNSLTSLRMLSGLEHCILPQVSLGTP